MHGSAGRTANLTIIDANRSATGPATTPRTDNSRIDVKPATIAITGITDKYAPPALSTETPQDTPPKSRSVRNAPLPEPRRCGSHSNQ